MGLEAALVIASGGLLNINRQIAVLSQNVSNAGTPNYATEVANQTSVAVGALDLGVLSAPASRVVNAALQNQAWSQNATVSALQTTSTALGSVDTALGATASGNDLPSVLNNLQSAFSTLENDPSNVAQQYAVVAAAQTLTGNINSLAATYTDVRQTAQDDLVSAITSLNTNLATIGDLTKQIVQLKNENLSSADLENQRDTAIQAVSQQVGAKFVPQSDGSLLAITTGGASLPLNGGAPFSIASATIGAGSTYPATSPAILLNGVDVTAQMTGGTIGANVKLRDSTIPTYQAELDEFSQNLASRFDAQGLTLFTDPTGAVPAAGTTTPIQAGYVGFSSIIQVNAAVVASPALVRDGTQDVAGSATGATAFTTNPATGPSGFTDLIARVLNYSFGTDVQDGVTQPAIQTAGLGASGTLQAGYDPPTTLANAAADIVAVQAQGSATVTGNLSTEQSVQTGLQTQVTNVSGVSVDAQMSLMVQLQNAYSANARVISAVQQMWNDLINSVSTTVA